MQEKHPLFWRVVGALGVFVVAVVLSMIADACFEKIRHVIGELSKRYDMGILGDLGFYDVNVTAVLLAVVLASGASFLLSEIAKSRTHVLAALVGVMVSGWFWHP